MLAFSELAISNYTYTHKYTERHSTSSPEIRQNSTTTDDRKAELRRTVA